LQTNAPGFFEQGNGMIAIYARAGSFSDRWIEACKDRDIACECVDMFADDLFARLHASHAEAFMCHPPMYDRRSSVAARSIVQACALAGMPVFPRVEDYWHFDDKIAQKYIFDALGVRTPATHVFLNRQGAIEWLENAHFPVVFKLKSGAGSVNVLLMRSKEEARSRVDRMFRNGYPATDAAFKDVRTKVRLHGRKRDWPATIRRLPRTVRDLLELRRGIDWERGYAYFQEFVPGNSCDTRVTVIGDRAFAFRRMVRPGDFRASGSGSIVYDQKAVNGACIEMAFAVAAQLKTSCIAFDFIQRPGDESPLIVEMSFAFMAKAVFDCPGHWRRDMSWHSGHVWPQDAVLDDIFASL
jgi:glutathione synthase/RimK-type ligase-like ATP-grasp enzyme